MPKFPEPPMVNILRSIKPDLRQLAQGTSLWRVYFRAGRYPSVWYEFRRFGPLSTARFDHHEPDAAGNPWSQDRAILYAALQGPTCIAEVFQSTRIIDRHARSLWLVAFSTARDLVLLDLCSTFPTRAGASMAINTGPRHHWPWIRQSHSRFRHRSWVRSGNYPKLAVCITTMNGKRHECEYPENS
jgi:RES domain